MQTLDVAVSLAKVADVDRGLSNEEGASAGFREAINLLESLKIDSSEVALEQRVWLLYQPLMLPFYILPSYFC